MSLSKYLSKYAIIIAAFFGLAYAIGTRGVVPSFVTLSISCLLVSILACGLLLSDSKLRTIVIGTFLLKMFIGIFHFLFFYDSNYFSGSGDILRIFQEDFTVYFDYVSSLVEEKDSYGLLYFDVTRQVTTHQELLNVIATSMCKFGVYALNIVPLNCLFSSLAAINIYICIEKTGIAKEKKKGLMWLLCLFPIFLDDAIFVRDIAGQFVMSIGVCLIVLSNEKTRFAWLIPAALLFYMQRTAYITVPFLMYMAQSFISKKKSFNFLFILLIMIAVALFMPNFGGIVGDEYEYRQKGMQSVSILSLPMRFLFSIIGPFPWWQFYVKGIVAPAYASQLYNYIAGVIHVGCLILVFSTERKYLKDLLDSEMFLMGLIVMGFGVIGGVMHITYIIAGTCFMVPVIYQKYNKLLYKSSMRKAFLILLAFNLFYLVVGGGFRDILV